MLFPLDKTKNIGITYQYESDAYQTYTVTDELGNTVVIKLWKIPPTTDKPKGHKYSLVYIVAGERVIGHDNAEQKGDHRHYGSREETYTFTTLRQLTDDFLNDVDSKGTYHENKKDQNRVQGHSFCPG